MTPDEFLTQTDMPMPSAEEIVQVPEDRPPSSGGWN
jgi:hypothetical protein